MSLTLSLRHACHVSPCRGCGTMATAVPVEPVPRLVNKLLTVLCMCVQHAIIKNPLPVHACLCDGRFALTIVLAGPCQTTSPKGAAEVVTMPRAYTTKQLHRDQSGIAVSLTIFRLNLRMGGAASFEAFEARDWLLLDVSTSPPRESRRHMMGENTRPKAQHGQAEVEVVTKPVDLPSYHVTRTGQRSSWCDARHDTLRACIKCAARAHSTRSRHEHSGSARPASPVTHTWETH